MQNTTKLILAGLMATVIAGCGRQDEAAGDAGQAIEEKAQTTLDTAAESASETADSEMQSAEDMASEAMDEAGQMAEEAEQQAGDLVEQAEEMVEEAGDLSVDELEQEIKEKLGPKD